ncbi:MAG: DUF5685 family protein [Candidatus Azobacteroides sp.]|nr:DUF5685 family protein [Candidatus Azobacteroides sp.]
MFGYFQPHINIKFSNFRISYKYYYCGLCHSLKYNYGQKARLLLSYDVALLDMLLNQYDSGCNSCKNGQHIKDTSERKIMAALNLLLFELKLKDDVYDENSFTAKVILKFYHKQTTKAKNDFPQLANVIERGNNKILENEKAKADALTMAESFAEMMFDITDIINPSAEHKSIIKGVSMWLYIIDAIDDYDKDWKSGNFNPFLNCGKKYKSFSDYMFVNFEKVSNMFRMIYACFNPVRGRNDLNTLQYEYIPATTMHILKGNKMKVIYPFNKLKRYSQIEALTREYFNIFVDWNDDLTVINNVINSAKQSGISNIKFIANTQADNLKPLKKQLDKLSKKTITDIEYEIQNCNKNILPLKLTVEQACLQFDDWLINGKTDIFLFSDIVKLIYRGIPHNCEYSSCLGKCVHITANKHITFCPNTQNGIAYEGQLLTEIFESAEFINLLEQTITCREECKSQCVAFNVCGGGCPLKSKSDCDFRINLYLHIKDKISKGNFYMFNEFVKNSIYRSVAVGGSAL